MSAAAWRKDRRESQEKKLLEGVTARVAVGGGQIHVTGRYHRLPKRIDDDYTLLKKELGNGYNSQENGPVRMAMRKQPEGAAAAGQQGDVRFAVKRFKLHGLKRSQIEELQAEVEVFLSMDHPHVARLVDAYEAEDWLSLVMELMEGGELFDRVIERKVYAEGDAANAVYQMLLAINYIHGLGVCHRDIKLEKFLYERKDTDHLKLIDFGFSNIWRDVGVKMQLSCGTLAYMAPEVLRKSYTSQCDMWSLGVIVFILLSGYMPFSGDEKVQMKAIEEGKYKMKPDKWKNVSKLGFQFMTSLLEVDSDKRLTAKQALQHQWILERASLPSGRVDLGIAEALQSFAQASRFRRACLSMMAWSLSLEERAKVRQIFLQIDTTQEGTITLPELKAAIEKHFAFDGNQVKEIFEKLDTNHDEMIHYSDFLAAMCASRIGMHDDLIMQAFRRFDTDNSGKISLANMKEVLGDSFEGCRVEEILQEVPHEGDEINYEDFVSYLRHGDASEKLQNCAENIIDKELKASEASGKGIALEKQCSFRCEAKSGRKRSPFGEHRADEKPDAKQQPGPVVGHKEKNDTPSGGCCAIA